MPIPCSNVFLCSEGPLKMREVRSEGRSSCSSVLQALIQLSAGKRTIFVQAAKIILCHVCGRGFFIPFQRAKFTLSATFGAIFELLEGAEPVDLTGFDGSSFKQFLLQLFV